MFWLVQVKPETVVIYDETYPGGGGNIRFTGFHDVAFNQLAVEMANGDQYRNQIKALEVEVAERKLLNEKQAEEIARLKTQLGRDA